MTQSGPPTTAELRLAFFSDAAPQRNGVGTYYRDLAEHLQGRVSAVQLFCPEAGATLGDEPIRLPLPGDATQRITIPNPRRLGRRFRQLAPHAVVLATPGPYGLMGLRLARKYDARVVVGFHTHFERLTDLYWQKSLVVGKLFRYYLETCNRLLFRHASVVLANSEDMLELARSLGAPRAELMGTTVPRPFIDTPVTPLRSQLQYITFAGRLAAEKNLESIIDAARSCPQLRFRVAGDGPQRSLVENAARQLDNFEYLGWVPRDGLLTTIDATDMLVLPSHVESFGTIALEAMTRNRTVLVSAACGITQWPQLSSALYRVEKHESTAAAIQRVAATDPHERSERAAAGREAAVALNEWTLQHWLGLFQRDIEPGPANA